MLTSGRLASRRRQGVSVTAAEACIFEGTLMSLRPVLALEVT